MDQVGRSARNFPPPNHGHSLHTELPMHAGCFWDSIPGVAVPSVGLVLACGDPSARLFSSPEAEDTSGDSMLRICAGRLCSVQRFCSVVLSVVGFVPLCLPSCERPHLTANLLEQNWPLPDHMQMLPA